MRPLLLALLLGSCTWRYEIEPVARDTWPDWYVRTWADVLACAGRDAHRDFCFFGELQFVEARVLDGPDGPLLGLWWPTRRTIYLRPSSVHDQRVLCHEMLHAAVSGDHDDPTFVRCSCRSARVGDGTRR